LRQNGKNFMLRLNSQKCNAVLINTTKRKKEIYEAKR